MQYARHFNCYVCAFVTLYASEFLKSMESASFLLAILDLAKLIISSFLLYIRVCKSRFSNADL